MPDAIQPRQLIDALTANGFTVDATTSFHTLLNWPGETGSHRKLAVPTASAHTAYDLSATGRTLADLARAADTGRRASRVLASLGGEQDTPDLVDHLDEYDGECSCGIEQVTELEQKFLIMFDQWYGDKAYRKHDEVIGWAEKLAAFAKAKSSDDEENRDPAHQCDALCRDVENERDLLGRQQQAVLDLCQEQEAYGFTTVTIDRLNQIFITDPADDPEQGTAGDPGPTHRAQSSERLAADIAHDLKLMAFVSGSARPANARPARLLAEAADKLMTLVDDLAAAETARDLALPHLRDSALEQHHSQCGEAGEYDIRRCEDANCTEVARLLEYHGLLPKEWGAYLAAPAGLDLSPAVERITAIAPGVALCGDTWLPADVIAGWRHAGGTREITDVEREAFARVQHLLVPRDPNQADPHISDFGRTPMQLCSDKAGPHAEHEWRDPDDLDVIIHCVGIPGPR